jgi:hypothetical protein
MIDLNGGGAHGSISLSTIANDFIFKVGNNNTPGSWAAAPTPSAVSVRLGAGTGGSDRVEITWTDGVIKNQWLEVQVLPTSRTGLTATDVFFWGNKIGDIGSPTATGFTTTASADANPIITGGLGSAGGITNPRDIDRSNTITAAGDRSAAIANIGSITRISLGTGGPFAPGEGDAGISSALAGAAAPAPAVALPPGIARRLQSGDLSANRIAAFFRHLATAGTPRAEAILTAADRAVEALGLDDSLFDELEDPSSAKKDT